MKCEVWNINHYF